tara:strand:- start:373 stop:675 length:303 start_codon:yes stop_codon:yes gene_type:complete
MSSESKDDEGRLMQVLQDIVVEEGSKWTSLAGLTVTVKRVGSATEIFKDAPQPIDYYLSQKQIDDTSIRWILTEWKIPGFEEVGENRLPLIEFLKIYKMN